jgi:glucokinase
VQAGQQERWIGVDIGGTTVKAGALQADGTVLEERTVDPGFSQGTSHALDVIARIAKDLGATRALGVGVPGLLRRKDGHVLDSPNIKGFHDLPLRAELARRMALPPEAVIVENDANAAALGEQWLGGGRGFGDFLLLTLGTGIGGGLILGGKLYAGEGMAGEVGHIVVDPTGIPCGCGSRGCVETLASATGARRRAIAAGLPMESPGDLILLAERARAGHAAEKQLLHEVGLDLGRGLGPVISLLDLHVFVFGGGFSAALDTMEEGVRAGAEERSYGARGSKLKFVRAQLGPAAGWIGAARPTVPGARA